MFGYVIMNKPEMKFKEYDLYQSYYCGLCRVLKDKYGSLGQMTLSYDMTFLVLLLTDLYEPDTKEDTVKCIAHPFEKHITRRNAITEYVADMNILLSYYQCMDDWEDDRKIHKLAYGKLIEGKNRKVAEKYPKKAEKICTLLDKIHAAEKEALRRQKANSFMQTETPADGSCNFSEKGEWKKEERYDEIKEIEWEKENLDIIAGYFGGIMSELFVYRCDEWETTLRKMGFFLGKFIYLMDAYEDIEADIEKKSYNPFTILYQKKGVEEFEKESTSILRMMMAECSSAFEILPVVEDVSILRNILYSGVWCRYEYVRQKRMGK